MLTASVETLLEVTDGDLLEGSLDTIANDVCIDSRVVPPGCLFVALPGDRVDGHHFIAEAVRAGARVVLVSRDPETLIAALDEANKHNAAVIRVPDTLHALQDLARWHRDRIHARVIGITGSTGKTTTKDFLTSVLGTTLRVAATQGNRNNELGMPLTVLSAGSNSDVLAVEMGMRGLGQIAELASIARPDVGLVTNVGTSHIELLGSQDAVATAKGELVNAVHEGGAVFLNHDDCYSERLASEAKARVITYGLGAGADIRATDIELDDASRPTFTLHAAEGTERISLPVSGKHNVYNALAAAAVGLYFGLGLENVRRGLQEAKLSAGRMQTFVTATGVTVVNDAYNANPTSMKAAVETLAAMNVPGRKIAVLGDMAELGSLTELAHFRIGEAVARLPIDALITIGERARRIAEGAVAAGMAGPAVRPCVTNDEAIEVLDDLVEPGDVVLVKASRVMGLETVVEGIVTPRVG